MAQSVIENDTNAIYVEQKPTNVFKTDIDYEVSFNIWCQNKTRCNHVYIVRGSNTFETKICYINTIYV